MNIAAFKNSSRPILITGETGSGKTQLASKIHANSELSHKPFVKLNLSALATNLFESELFGHCRGAFTGAVSEKAGLLASANNGTVFLDEIGELTLDKQVKLLHVLDDGQYFPVGSTSAKKFSGRFIFATNKNLSALIKKGEFREDLYYRIRFCQVELNPIRQMLRRELELEILERLNNLKVRNSRYQLRFSTEFMAQLLAYKWPGNYRELQNTLDYLVSLGEDYLTIKHLPVWIKPNEQQNIQKVESNKDYYKALERFERDYFEKVMRHYSGQINKTALEIGLSKVTLISKLKRYDIDRRNFKCMGEAVGF